MAIDLYWGRSSAYCWRVLLALEHKGLEYRSHLLQFDRQEHKAPQMLAMNPRGQLPVLRDGDYVVFESVGDPLLPRSASTPSRRSSAAARKKAA